MIIIDYYWLLVIISDYHYYAKDHPLTNNHSYYDAKDYHILYDELDCIIIYNSDYYENLDHYYKKV